MWIYSNDYLNPDSFEKSYPGHQYVILKDKAMQLAQAYLHEGVLADKYLLDARHIAMATLSRVDVMVKLEF